MAEFSFVYPCERLRLLMTDDMYPHKLLCEIKGQTLIDVVRWGLQDRQ